MYIIISTLLYYIVSSVYHSYSCRFEEEESQSRPPCAYIPLGRGPRNCVGMKLAKLMTKTALVALLKTHRFITTPSTVGTLQTKITALTAFIKSDVFLNIEMRKSIKN